MTKLGRKERLPNLVGRPRQEVLWPARSSAVPPPSTP